MTHPLKCPNCGEFRYIDYIGKIFKDSEKKKGFGVTIPFFICKNCEQKENILPHDSLMEFKEENLPFINDGEFIEMPLKFIFSRLDSEKRFKHYDYLEMQYDPRDYYIIPGLYREWDDGALTPVFFDKDLLLWYNGHPDYSVKLTSFSSGNIYYKGERMFDWGFGINRNGKIFKWLGDLSDDFKDKNMKSHLKRFQASNVPSDHEVVSKFYFSQNPFSLSDVFQTSDNETRLFYLNNDFNLEFKKKFGFELSILNIEELAEYYKPPIVEERDQIFSSYLSLNKYLVENLQKKNLRKILLKGGFSEKDLQKDGNKLGSLKLLTLFMTNTIEIKNANKVVSPLFVLYDLRQLHGHLHDKSFDEEYSSCKTRLELPDDATDFEVFTTLVKKLIILYQKLLEKIK